VYTWELMVWPGGKRTWIDVNNQTLFSNNLEMRTWCNFYWILEAATISAWKEDTPWLQINKEKCIF
jgi:hypothetical protein